MSGEIERLTAIISRACIEMDLPEEYIDGFSDSVADCVKEMEKKDVHYDAGTIFDAIKSYDTIVMEAPSRPKEGLVFEIYSYAAITSAYFLAREAALKDPLMRNLFLAEDRGQTYH